MNLIFTFSALIFSSIFAQKEKVTIIPKLSVGDKLFYEFELTPPSPTKEVDDSQKVSYEAQLKVLDVVDNGFKLQLDYKNYLSPNSEDEMENDFHEIMNRVPIIFDLDLQGIRQQLYIAEMRKNGDQQFDQWAANQSTYSGADLKEFKELTMMTFESQPEYFIRDLDFMFPEFGQTFTLNEKTELKSFYNYPMVGNLEGFRTIELVAIDQQAQTATLKILSGITKATTKALIIAYIYNNLEIFGLENKEQLDLNSVPSFSVEQELILVYNLKNGLVMNGKYFKHQDGSEGAQYERKLFWLKEE